MTEMFQWIEGVLLAGLAIIVGAFWKFLKMVNDLRMDTEQKTDALHSRVNRIREDMVTKKDYDGHLQNLRDELRQLREEHNQHSSQLTGRIDAVMKAITYRNESRD